MKKFFLKVTRDNLPQVKDKYPFIYLEHGRLEIDDSSVKWIDADCNVVPLPVATINTILLGPGTTVTHAAIAALASANCTVCWTGSESLIFYAAGFGAYGRLPQPQEADFPCFRKEQQGGSGQGNVQITFPWR